MPAIIMPREHWHIAKVLITQLHQLSIYSSGVLVAGVPRLLPDIQAPYSLSAHRSKDKSSQ
jgi:hypothetical protein